jgi:hypothetical protein
VALDVIGRRLVHLFHHANTGRYLQLPLGSGKSNTDLLPITTRAASSILGNRAAHSANRKQQISIVYSVKRILIGQRVLEGSTLNQKLASDTLAKEKEDR